jgi:8-oxo-dGTP pyrophosphatase MutT (NUDIX family)
VTASLLGAGASELRSSSELSDLIRGLETLGNLDRQQSAVRDEMLEFAGAHPDALHRTCVEGHFTGSALVVEEQTGRILVLFHTKLRKWLQPGGHTDGEATMAITALREATEETGLDGLRVHPIAIDLDIHEVRPPAEPPHLHLDIRHLVLAPHGSVPVGNHESESLRWVTPEELAVLGVDESVLRLVRSGLELAGQLPEAGLG